MERLGLIAMPIIADCGPGNFLNSTVLKIECQTESNWVKFLNKKSSVLM